MSGRPMNRRVLRMSKVEVRAAAVCPGGSLGDKKIAVLQLLEGANVLWRKCAVPAAATGGLRDNGSDEKRKKKIKQNQYSNR